MLAPLLALCSLALAGDLYVNGVKATGLRGQTFDNADVRIDDSGDIHITAPNYVVRTIDPLPATIPATAPDQGAVSAGYYWLVTEDNRSSGHTVEVFINGNLVRSVRSGEPQIILDLSPWLTPGINNVTFSALPGPQPAGGVLHLYMGTGYNDAGVIRMHAPQIDYARRSSDPPMGGMTEFDLTAK